MIGCDHGVPKWHVYLTVDQYRSIVYMAHCSMVCDIPKPHRQVIYPMQMDLVDLGIRAPLHCMSRIPAINVVPGDE